jgi:hypothetical protein
VYNASAKSRLIQRASHNLDAEFALNNCILAELISKVERQYSLLPTRNVRESCQRLYAAIIYFLISRLAFVILKPRYGYPCTRTWFVQDQIWNTSPINGLQLRPSLVTSQSGNVRHERDMSLVSSISRVLALFAHRKLHSSVASEPTLFLPDTMTESSVASGFQK